MKPRIRIAIFSLLMVLSIRLSFAEETGVAEKSGWPVVKIDGDSYVSADAIKTFYQFEERIDQAGSVVLHHPKVKLELSRDEERIVVNGSI